MSSSYGDNIRITIFGQSHSSHIGVTIEGLPTGIEIDMEELGAFLSRRAPGKNSMSTARKEADLPEFVSGLFNGKTCGAPLTALIKNGDTRSKDYSELKIKPRPGHADYTAEVKYNGFQDYTGGGHFSGRLTAPLCIAGGICIQALKKAGINIYSHVYAINGIQDDSVEAVNPDEAALEAVKSKEIPVINDEAGKRMQEIILSAKEQLDSVGGIVECVATNIPAGVGDPMFDGMENRIAKIVFGIPAVKGLEFGNGFECTKLYGSENNDEYYYDENGKIKTRTNNHGGILGGITSGMPVIFRAALKPTPSIAREQNTVNLESCENTVLNIKGRHDPCIVLRVVPVIEAAAAIAIYDAYLERKKNI